MLWLKNGLSWTTYLHHLITAADFPSSALMRAMLLHCTISVILSPSAGGQFQPIGPPQTVVALVGSDVILPCHLTPALNAEELTVEWTRPDLDPKYVHIRRDGRELLPHKNPAYVGRTSLLEGLRNGDVSLQLAGVKLSDEGTYRFFIPKLDKESFVTLVVGVVPSPAIILVGLNNGKWNLGCQSTGWYPEPEVSWLDSDGNLLNAKPTETVRHPDGLYTVRNNATVEKTNTNRFTCRIQQQIINQTRETMIHIPDELFSGKELQFAFTRGLGTGLGVGIVAALVLSVVVWTAKRWYLRRHQSTVRKYAHTDRNQSCTYEL